MGRDDYLEVACPDCKAVIIVHRRTGEVVEVRRPILEEGSGDRFEDAMRKVRGSGDAVQRKVEEARAREKEKMNRLNSLFRDGMEKAREEGPPQRPDRDLDLD